MLEIYFYMYTAHLYSSSFKSYQMNCEFKNDVYIYI